MGMLEILTPWRHVRLAQGALERGEAAEAAERLKGLNLSRLTQGRRARAYLLEGEIFAELGDVDTCLAALEAALALQPRPSRLREGACAIHRRLSVQGRHRAALKAADLGLSHGPGDQGLLLARCESLVALGKVGDGAAGFRLILARDPLCGRAMLGLARLKLEGDAPEEAIKLCLRALAANPPMPDLSEDNLPTLHVLTRAWLKAGQAEACVDFFRDMPDEAGWIRAYGLGAGLAALGEAEHAAEVLLEAIREDDCHPFIFQLLREVGGDALSPMPLFEIAVRLKWQGSHIPSMARMLPEDLIRSYRVGAKDADAALTWVRRAQPRRVFEPDPEVLTVEPLGELEGGQSGIYAVLQGQWGGPS